MMKKHEAVDCVKLVPIFQALSDSDVHLVAGLIRDVHLTAGTTIFSEGMMADRLYIVAHGQVKITQQSQDGHERLLRLLQPGDFDGEAMLFTQTEHVTSGIALTDVALCTISQYDFQKLLRQTPQLTLNVLNALGRQLFTLETHVTENITRSTLERLALYLVETGAALNQDEFDLPLMKKDLALYLDTTAETISRKLRQLSDAKLIEQIGRQRIRLLDSDGLMLIC